MINYNLLNTNDYYRIQYFLFFILFCVISRLLIYCNEKMLGSFQIFIEKTNFSHLNIYILYIHKDLRGAFFL